MHSCSSSFAFYTVSSCYLQPKDSWLRQEHPAWASILHPEELLRPGEYWQETEEAWDSAASALWQKAWRNVAATSGLELLRYIGNSLGPPEILGGKEGGRLMHRRQGLLSQLNLGMWFHLYLLLLNFTVNVFPIANLGHLGQLFVQIPFPSHSFSRLLLRFQLNIH